MGIIETLLRGRVSRVLPQPDADGSREGEPLRSSPWGDLSVQSPITKKHLLADEGSYFVSTMEPEATALQLGISAAFAATAAAIVLRNGATAGRGQNVRIFLDYIRMLVVTPPTSATHWKAATVVDDKDRTPTTISNGSGGTGPGTPATVTAYRSPIVCPNMDEQPGLQDSVQLYFPLSTSGGAPPTVPSAGGNKRTLCGQMLLRGQIPVALDEYIIDFGGDVPPMALVTAAPAGASRVVVPHCPVVIGPQQSFLLHMWGSSNATAGLALAGLEVGGWVR